MKELMGYPPHFKIGFVGNNPSPHVMLPAVKKFMAAEPRWRKNVNNKKPHFTWGFLLMGG